MKIPWPWILNLFLVILLTMLCTAFQTSLWLQVIGSFPPPNLWLCILVYLALNRSMGQAVFWFYLLSIALSGFTIFPVENFLLLNMLMLTTMAIVKARIQWDGPTYYMLMCGAMSLLAPVLFWSISRLTDDNPVFIPEIFIWLISGLMTMLFSLVMYKILDGLDRLTLRDSSSEGLRLYE